MEVNKKIFLRSKNEDTMSKMITFLHSVHVVAAINEGRWEESERGGVKSDRREMKDIVWFHSVIWPCMLQSANIPLPKTVYCHGFVNAEDGRKMSKTYENTIDPHDVRKSSTLWFVRWNI